MIAAVDIGLWQPVEVDGEAGRERGHAPQHRFAKLGVDGNRQARFDRPDIVGPQQQQGRSTMAALGAEVDATGRRCQ